MNELDLFTEALSHTDPAERAAFLDQACAGNPELRARIEALLAGHARSASPLDRPPFGAEATVDLPTKGATGAHRRDEGTKTASDFDPGATRAGEATVRSADSGAPDATEAATLGATRPSKGRAQPDKALDTVVAGRYTLLEVIGEGGMGSVYRASQTQPVKRQVALKLIKTGMDSRDVLARFDAERQALALMDHPNIARIYDGGVTDAGQPFFVMELVDGVPITEYCDQKRLSVKGRLELFVAVCQAVQHAHQKGIIHRDLKPSNVMVTEVDGKPTPKVIDFGVAKATEQKLTDMSLADTGALVGTPAYMSPEQADPTSMDIDTRTDVYALGVMLYELLTGAPPIDASQFKRGAILEMLRMVREVDPPRPSTKLSTADALPNIAANRGIEPARLAKLLQGELDWVVMKALEKDRTRRYDTANGLARDLQRYLDDEVVEARPPSAGYRLTKFVRRNKGQVIAASLIVFALLAGIVGTTFGLIRANRAAIAERLAKLDAQDQKGRAEKRSAQIEKGNAILGAIFDDLDIHKVKEGKDPLEAVMAKRLLKAAAQLEGEAIGDPLVVADLQSRLGRALEGLGYAKEAIPLFTKASETYAEKQGPDGYDTLKTLHSLAGAYKSNGMFDESVALSEDVLRRTKATLGDDHRDTIAVMISLGLAYQTAGKMELAIPLLEEAFKRSKGRPGAASLETTACMSNLGLAYLRSGKLDQAQPMLEECLRLIETNLGPDHPDTLVVMTNLAGCYRELGKTELALPLVEKILKRRKELLGADHPDTLMSMNNLAAMYDSIGKPDLALPLIVESVELQRVKLGDDHPSTLVSMTNLAECYRRVKQLDRSVAIFEETLKTAKAKLGTDHPIVSKCTHGLAAAYWATKQFDKAIPMFEDLVKRSEAKLGRHHPETLILMANLGANYNDAGRIKEAISVLEEVNTFIDEYPRLRGFDLPLCEAYATAGESVKLATLRLKHLSEARAALPKESPQIGAILAQIGMGLLVEKKWAEAEPFLRECLAIREKTQPDVWSTFNTKSQLGGSLLGQHKYAESEPLLIAGYEGMKQREKTIQPVGRPRLPEALDRLIELYTATDRPDEVKKWQAERAKYPAAAPPPGEKK